MDFWEGLNSRLRTAITLACLTLLVVVGVSWGLGQLTRPLPTTAEAPLCVPTDYAAGDQLRPEDVTVSVLNASGRSGLADRTLQLFEDQGFTAGQVGNAPEGTQVATAEIWTDQTRDPAAKLVRSRLGRVPVRPDGDSPVLGITVVVGDGFTELTQGALAVTVDRDTSICSPPPPT